MKIEREAPDHLPIKKITVRDDSYMLAKRTGRSVTLQPFDSKIRIRHKSCTEGDCVYYGGNFELSITAARELAEALCILIDDMEERV